jgi:phosphoglycerate dehydrogenase-like enzyme
MDAVNTSAVRVVLTFPDHEGLAGPLRTLGVEVLENHELLQGEALNRVALNADVVVIRASQRVGAAFFMQPGVRVKQIVQAAAGIDNIDLQAARQAGVEVQAVDPGNATAVAEWTLLHLLAVTRNATNHWSGTRWDWGAREESNDGELRGRRLGIVGLGRCGSRVARRALAFEMEVSAIDPYIPLDRFVESGVRRFDRLEPLLEWSEALTLHCPLDATTRGMIGRQELARMQPGAILLNSARGGLVDEQALLEALAAGRLAGAAIDVWCNEPRTRTGLAAHPCVLATSHIAGHTAASHRARRENLLEALSGLCRSLAADSSR